MKEVKEVIELLKQADERQLRLIKKFIENLLKKRGVD